MTSLRFDLDTETFQFDESDLDMSFWNATQSVEKSNTFEARRAPHNGITEADDASSSSLHEETAADATFDPLGACAAYAVPSFGEMRTGSCSPPPQLSALSALADVSDVLAYNVPFAPLSRTTISETAVAPAAAVAPPPVLARVGGTVDASTSAFRSGAAWIRDRPVRIGMHTHACYMLLCIVPHPGTSGLGELNSMTAAQHYDAAENGTAATSISETVRSLLERREVRYGVALPDGHFVAFKHDWLITQTKLDRQSYYATLQRNPRAALVAKFGRTYAGCAGVFKSLSIWCVHEGLDWQVRAKLASGVNTQAHLDALRVTDPSDGANYEHEGGKNPTGTGFKLSIKSDTDLYARRVAVVLDRATGAVVLNATAHCETFEKNGEMHTLKLARSAATDSQAGRKPERTRELAERKNKKRKLTPTPELTAPTPALVSTASTSSTSTEKPAPATFFSSELFDDELPPYAKKAATESAARTSALVPTDRAMSNLSETLRDMGAPINTAPPPPLFAWMRDMCTLAPPAPRKLDANGIPVPPPLPPRIQ